MKRALILLSPVAVRAASVGCDETMLEGLPSDVQALVSSADGIKIGLFTQAARVGHQQRLRDQLRLMDGSPGRGPTAPCRAP